MPFDPSASDPKLTATGLTTLNGLPPLDVVWRETDTGLRKKGDGLQRWNQLPYEGSGAVLPRMLDPDDLLGSLTRRVALLENPLASDYFTTAFTTADVPTFSFQMSTPTITGTLQRPLRFGNNATSLDMANDTAFRIGGVPYMDPLTANNAFVVPDLLPDGAGQAARYMPWYEVQTSAANTAIEWKFRPPATAMGIRVMVDGKWVSDQATRFTGMTAGGTAYVKMDWAASAKSRRVRVYVEGAIGFDGVQYPTGQPITRPVSTIPRRVAFLGDSFTGGAGSPTDGAGRMEVWSNFVGHLLGPDADCWNFGIGGTGYTTTFPFINRAAAVTAANPDVVVILGSRNDGSDPGVYDAAVALLQALSSVKQVYVVGPIVGSYSVINEQLRRACAATNRPFIDALAAGWITLAGLGSDTIHPTYASHKLIADGVYKAIRPYVLTS